MPCQYSIRRKGRENEISSDGITQSQYERTSTRDLRCGVTIIIVTSVTHRGPLMRIGSAAIEFRLYEAHLLSFVNFYVTLKRWQLILV